MEIKEKINISKQVSVVSVYRFVGLCLSKIFHHFYRPRTEYGGRLCFYRCLSVNRGYTARSRRGWGVPQVTYSPGLIGATPRYPTPWQRYLPPSLVRWGQGYPKVPTPWPRYLPPQLVPIGGGSIPRYLPPPRYLPFRPGPDRGYPKVPTPRDRTAYGVLNTPRSVCLLRSRRRTFLFLVCLYSWKIYVISRSRLILSL